MYSVGLGMNGTDCMDPVTGTDRYPDITAATTWRHVFLRHNDVDKSKLTYASVNNVM